jgi:TrmH family RNA methyltransferase
MAKTPQHIAPQHITPQHTTPQHITSRDNPLLQRLRKLMQDGTGYRRLGAVWLEGEHLCSALQARGKAPSQAVLAESAWQVPRLRELALAAPRCAVLPDGLYAQMSQLPSPAQIGYVFEPGPEPPLLPEVATVVLDGVQDAGNVGSILRSASAFGIVQVLALTGTAGLWSPKVLRAGMGAHFGLRLREGLPLQALDALAVPLLATSSHAADTVHAAALPRPCAWVFGHEGQGVQAALIARCGMTLRIAQPGGEESLNVAAAAAICLHEAARA